MHNVATIDEIRHTNFLALLSQHKTIQAFADRLQRSHSQVSQLKNRNKHSSGGEPRVIGDDFARHIEVMMGKPPGWMDSPHDGETDRPLSAKALRMAVLYDAADAERQGIMYSTVVALAGVAGAPPPEPGDEVPPPGGVTLPGSPSSQLHQNP